MKLHLSSKHQIIIEDKTVLFQKSKMARYSFNYDEYFDINQMTKEAVCKKCGKTISKNLKRHILYHQPKGTREFQCNRCGKSFADKIILKRHIEFVHEGVRNHMCSDCGLKFTDKQKLIKHHKVVHQGIKEFKCDKCAREFGQKIDLRRHIEGGE